MDEKYTLDAGVTASPEGDNLLLWSGVIFGPDETIWEGGMFKVKIVFPGTYPQKPPKVFMLSKGVFHPNICPRTGWICLDIFKGSWSPAYEVGSFLIAIKSILNDPNLKSMANPEAGDLFMKDYNAYK
jgi:ubiquitin-conjugating enzyme E2 A